MSWADPRPAGTRLLRPEEREDPHPYVVLTFGEWESSGHQCGDIKPGGCDEPAPERQVTARAVDGEWLVGWELGDCPSCGSNAEPRPVIVVDPAVRFGRPHIGGISCEALAGMVAAGEDAAVVADEYGRSRGEVLLACWWIGMDGPPRWQKRWRAWAESAHQRLARGEYDEVEDPLSEETTDA